MRVKIYGNCPDCGKLATLVEAIVDFTKEELTDEVIARAHAITYGDLPILEIDGELVGAGSCNYVEKFKIVRRQYDIEREKSQKH